MRIQIKRNGSHLVQVPSIHHSFDFFLLCFRQLGGFTVKPVGEAEDCDVVGKKIHFVVEFFDSKSAQSDCALIGAECTEKKVSYGRIR
jgi:hypothetical protein